VIAAAASGAAAIVVSHVWKDGTVIAAAMTPVIVSIVKEMLARPMESELVKKPVSKIASGSRAAIGTALPIGARSRAEQRGQGDPLMPDEPPATEPRGARSAPNGARPDPRMTPIRTYGTATRRRRPIHLKVALITGLVAFLLAAAVLTLPELIFGGAISSHHSTTFFGGASSKSTGKTNKDKGSTQPNQKGTQSTTPATPPPTTGGKTPTSTTPQPQQTTPQQTAPQQTTPPPTSPTPPVPSAP
jgi:hypothetical protein